MAAKEVSLGGKKLVALPRVHADGVILRWGFPHRVGPGAGLHPDEQLRH